MTEKLKRGPEEDEKGTQGRLLRRRVLLAYVRQEGGGSSVPSAPVEGPVRGQGKRVEGDAAVKKRPCVDRVRRPKKDVRPPMKKRSPDPVRSTLRLKYA